MTDDKTIKVYHVMPNKAVQDVNAFRLQKTSTIYKMKFP